MERKVKQYRFGTFGPFELPLENGFIDEAKLKNFWTSVESEQRGLSTALGCYIFVVKNEEGILPWYMGKTEKRHFRFETLQPHKIKHYLYALHANPNGRAYLFLIPRLTEGGGFRKVWKSGPHPSPVRKAC